MWDIGGQESLRQAWSTYYSGTQFVILVVDSTDRDRLAVSREELYKMLGNDVSMGQSHETSLSCGFPPETESKLLSCNNNAELRTIDSLTQTNSQSFGTSASPRISLVSRSHPLRRKESGVTHV